MNSNREFFFFFFSFQQNKRYIQMYCKHFTFARIIKKKKLKKNFTLAKLDEQDQKVEEEE